MVAMRVLMIRCTSYVTGSPSRFVNEFDDNDDSLRPLFGYIESTVPILFDHGIVDNIKHA